MGENPKVGKHPVNNPLAKPREIKGLKCAEPGCSGTLRLRFSNRIGNWFYGCDQWPACEGILPCAQNGMPRGKPRTRELQGWRNKAHQAFDRLWRDGHCSRAGAYNWLREVMGLDSKEAHMFMMGIDNCKTVIEKVETHGPGTEFWAEWRARKKGDEEMSDFTFVLRDVSRVFFMMEQDSVVAKIQVHDREINGIFADDKLNERQMEALKKWSVEQGLVCPKILVTLGRITPKSNSETY